MHAPTLRIFRSKDAPADWPNHERVAVLGYGNLGRSFALNLRDAGVKELRVGNIEDDYAKLARADGFTVTTLANAADADIVLLALPDEVIPEVFASDIAPNLPAHSSIVVASGYCLAYNLLKLPPGIDVLMLAPRMGGEKIRERYVSGAGYHAYISVEQDVTGRAWHRLLGLANAVGALSAGAYELDAKREALLDLFIEQTLGAMIGAAVMQSFSVGVEGGLPPEALALEMYLSGEMETVWQGFRKDGFAQSASTHGPTAMFGGMMRTMQIFQSGILELFEKVFAEIQSGQFATQFQAEREAGYPRLKKIREMGGFLDPIGDAEKIVRDQLADN